MRKNDELNSKFRSIFSFLLEFCMSNSKKNKWNRELWLIVAVLLICALKKKKIYVLYMFEREPNIKYQIICLFVLKCISIEMQVKNSNENKDMENKMWTDDAE